MDEERRKQISNENEEEVQKWFESSGFDGLRLDSASGKHGKSADWRFTKHDLVVICEVKTIFSGGQSGLTQQQYERQRLQEKRKFDYYKAQAIADGTTLIAFKEQLDYIEGKAPYSGTSGTKEVEFNNFLEDVRDQLKTDKSINELPFSVSVSIGMYVAYGEERKQFINWLRGFVLWASTHHNFERIHSTSTFTFRPRLRTKDGTTQNAIEAFVQILGPLPGGQLEVGFTHSGVSYHEHRITDVIRSAMPQLEASIEREKLETVLPVIAVWSESRQLRFGNLLLNDVIEMQLNNLPDRYYLFDWAFSEYPKLAAIILFELQQEGDFWKPTPDDRISPKGYVITNPNLPEAEEVLKAAITENCWFITGLAYDPLTESIEKGDSST